MYELDSDSDSASVPVLRRAYVFVTGLVLKVAGDIGTWTLTRGRGAAHSSSKYSMRKPLYAVRDIMHVLAKRALWTELVEM
jgi:hypothetical protein